MAASFLAPPCPGTSLGSGDQREHIGIKFRMHPLNDKSCQKEVFGRKLGEPQL